MIKLTNESLEIYYKYSKTLYGMIQSSAAFFSSISLFLLSTPITKNKILFFIINIILIYLCYYIPKASKNKLEFKLTKQYIEIHSFKKILTIETKDILNIAPFFLSVNDILPKGIIIEFKKDLKIQPLTHIFNAHINISDFVNIANNFLKDDSINNTIVTNDILSKTQKNFYNDCIPEELYKQFKNGAKLDFCFIGKKQYSSLDTYITYLFVDEFENEIYLPITSLSIQDISELKCNCCYTICFDNNNKLYILSKTNKQFDSKIIQHFKNKITIKNNFWFSDDIINKEFEFKKSIDNHLEIITKIYAIFFLLVLLLMFINLIIGTIALVIGTFALIIDENTQHKKVHIEYNKNTKIYSN